MSKLTQEPQRDISQDEFNNLIYASKQLEQEASYYKRQMELLNEYKHDLQEAENTLEELKKCKENHNLLVPIGGENFVRAIVKKTDTVVGSIGARVHVEQPISNAIERVRTKKSDVEKQLNEIKSSYNGVLERLKEIGRVIRSIS